MYDGGELEGELLKAYSELTKEGKAAILDMARRLAEEKKPATPPAELTA